MKYVTEVVQLLNAAIDLSLLATAGFLLWLAYTGHITVMSGANAIMILIK